MMHPQFIALPQKAKDITGQRFGKLIALGPVDKYIRPKATTVIWLCQCDCGNTTRVHLGSLTHGDTKSCGCFRIAKAKISGRTHGMSDTKLYKTYNSMIERCTKPTNRSYRNYGARGITVCDEWKDSFQAYHDYVTQLPNYGTKNFTLDRINNNGNYEPGNVRWASPAKQSRNRRNVSKLRYNGFLRTLPEWAAELGIPYGTLYYRLNHGWSIERTFSTPLGAGRKAAE